MVQISFTELVNTSYDNMIKEGMTHDEAVKEMKRIIDIIDKS